MKGLDRVPPEEAASEQRHTGYRSDLRRMFQARDTARDPEECKVLEGQWGSKMIGGSVLLATQRTLLSCEMGALQGHVTKPPLTGC